MTHLFDSLQAAARLAVIQPGYARSEIKPERWATTYRSSCEQVNEALDIAENGSRRLPEEVAAAAPPSITQEDEEE